MNQRSALMAIGIGTDIVEIARIEDATSRQGLNLYSAYSVQTS